MRVLNVAEKNSVARSVAGILGRGREQQRQSWYVLPSSLGRGVRMRA